MKSAIMKKSESSVRPLFENWEKLMRIEDASRTYRIPKATFYDWKYRSEEKQIPQGLFVKFRRRLFIRTDVLNHWLESQVS